MLHLPASSHVRTCLPAHVPGQVCQLTCLHLSASSMHACMHARTPTSNADPTPLPLTKSALSTNRRGTRPQLKTPATCPHHMHKLERNVPSAQTPATCPHHTHRTACQHQHHIECETRDGKHVACAAAKEDGTRCATVPEGGSPADAVHFSASPVHSEAGASIPPVPSGRT